MLSHHNLISNLMAGHTVVPVSEDDVSLSFLPLSHSFERLVSYVYLAHGVTIVFAESMETVGRDLAIVRPTVMTGVPRVYEKFQARILERGHALPQPRRTLFHWGVKVAHARARAEGGGGKAGGRPRARSGAGRPARVLEDSRERRRAPVVPRVRQRAAADARRRVLPRPRAADHRRLRPDRDVADRDRQSDRRAAARHGRQADSRRRGPHRRRRRDPGARAQRDDGVLQQARGDGGRAAGRVVPHRRHRRRSTPRATCGSPTARRTCSSPRAARRSRRSRSRRS